MPAAANMPRTWSRPWASASAAASRMSKSAPAKPPSAAIASASGSDRQAAKRVTERAPCRQAADEVGALVLQGRRLSDAPRREQAHAVDFADQRRVVAGQPARGRDPAGARDRGAPQVRPVEPVER